MNSVSRKNDPRTYLKFDFYSADISVDVKVKLIVEIVALQNHLS